MAEKLTPEEIKKALECCKRDFSMRNCLDCPYNKENSAKCMSFMIKDALDLINHQQAEIERLNKQNETLHKRYLNKHTAYCELEEELEETKSEAIKEFAERLKNLIRFSNQPDRHYIDNLVKEMVGK